MACPVLQPADETILKTERAQRACRASLLPELVLFAVAAVWGINPPVIKLGLQSIPPQPYNVARLVVACLVSFLALYASRCHRRPSRGDLWRIFKVSAFGFFVFQIFFAEGIARTTSGNASFILCLMPASVLLINRLFGLETISRSVAAGIACSILGVAVIVVGSGRALSVDPAHASGALLLVVSQGGYAYYTVFSRELQKRYSTFQITAYLMAFTTLLLGVATLRETLAVDWAAVPATAWGSVLFSGALALCAGNFLWIWAAGAIGSSRTAVFNNLSPIFAVATGYVLLGESFGVVQVGGALLIVAGVSITRRRRQASERRAA